MNEQQSLFDTGQAGLLPCPFCNDTQRLDLRFHKATNKYRRGAWDASIYCRKCLARGPRVTSEDLGILRTQSESPKIAIRGPMEQAAIKAWNRRIDNAQVSGENHD